MNKRTQEYLAHAENRIYICRANELLFSAKKDEQWVEKSKAEAYDWIGRAQDNLEAHF